MKFPTAAGALLLAASLLPAAHGFAPAASLSRSPSRRAVVPRTVSALRMSAGSPLSVGVVGATGAVWKEIVGCLEARDFPAGSLRIFGSSRSAGREVATEFGAVTVELFDEDKARECDVVFLAVDGDFSLAHAENLCRGDDGPVVIDNSSAFRFVDGIPLVVPEINADECKGQKLIANPNCTTAIGLMAIWPLHQLF